ncbi:hypothetical protein LINPERHAP1_LOCUS20495 [Linum perenne]
MSLGIVRVKAWFPSRPTSALALSCELNCERPKLALLKFRTWGLRKSFLNWTLW